MKQYTIDELRVEDYCKIRSHMEEFHNDNCIEGIYRIFLDDNLLSDEQKEHASECGPFYFAVELDSQSASFEFLVRAKNKIRCGCIRYADKKQRDWLIDYVDSTFNQISVIT
ncbi:MAG: hypothetical protein JRJ44_04290 [Deltaproteobacteria bacterium]|nr:hypothetical protein [Deltaproteobacteria bacterium]